MKEECFCSFCQKEPKSTASLCERIRVKISKQKHKERERTYERKYTLTEFLSGVTEKWVQEIYY